MTKPEGHLGTVYIAGPMRGYPRFNFDAFEKAYRDLKTEEFDVLSPHKHDLANGFDPDKTLEENGFDLKAALKWDVNALLVSDYVYVLDGWENSEGARIEVALAHASGIPVWDEAGFVVNPAKKFLGNESAGDETITDEAHRLVYGVRGEDYGPPTEDFERTGRIWAAILGLDAVTAKQVALCMAGVKLSREVHRPKRDNLVDAIGYVLCGHRIETEA